MMHDETSVSVTLYVGVPHQCSYLENETTTLYIIDPQFSMNSAFYGGLLAQGFRRSGDMVYRPGCEKCHACIPARIPATYYKANRSQKRTCKVNRDIDIRYRSQAGFSDVHFELYNRYLESRHQESGMAEHTQEQMEQFLGCSWGETELIEGWLDDQLVMVAVTDRTPNALSALYTFFDPQLHKRSLGTFGILCQLERCTQLGLPWLYLGYWIENCRKMSYKQAFKPIELLQEGEWSFLDDTRLFQDLGF